MKIMGMGWPELLIILIISVGLGYACGKIASKKGYSFGGFFALGFFFEIIGLIIALVVPDKNSPSASRDTADALVQYKRLLDEGVITQAEFDAKKQELLKPQS